MSEFKSYPGYKDSGVEWLGEVPAHWVIKRIKWEIFAQSGTDQKYEGGVFPLFGANGVIGETNTASIQGPCVLIGRVGSAGEINFISQPAGVSDNALIVSNHVFNVPRYDFYLFHSIDIKSSVSKNAQPLIKASSFRDRIVAVPMDANERLQIARFLDHETARIDALIEEQQRLIELLKEKRQAVISHAVTKGLDPTVPMKDSGVEWLGEVPAHWALRPLKYQCRFSGGGTPSKDNLEYWNGDIPWVSPKDMKRFWLSDTEDKITELAIQESSANLVKSGALLMVVRSGILQRTIPVAINTVPVTLNQDMKALIFDGERTAEFVAFFISGFERPILQAWRKQGATVESIEHEYVANTMIPIPPKEELVGIVNAMRAVEVKFDSLSSESACLIRKLQERRSALISAAVTGKIDVRNWQPPAGHYPVGDTQNRTEPEVV